MERDNGMSVSYHGEGLCTHRRDELTGSFHAGTTGSAESLSCFMSPKYKVSDSRYDRAVVEGA